MARLARLVVPGIPHHVTQRGNRREETFFCDDDYQAYLDLTAEWYGEHKVAVWAYYLMPNQVHLIVVPKSEDGLRGAIGEAHRRYTYNCKRTIGECVPLLAQLERHTQVTPRHCLPDTRSIWESRKQCRPCSSGSFSRGKQWHTEGLCTV